MKSIFSPALAVSLGCIGAVIAYQIGFPAPLLTGSALVVLVASLLGLPLSVPMVGREAAFMVIGLTVGQLVNWEALTNLVRWPLSFLLLSASLTATLFLGRWLLVRFWHHSPTTGALATMPGHLSYVISVSDAIGGNVAAVSIAQSIRVAALVFLLPLAIDVLGADVAVGATPPQLAMRIELLVMTAAAGVALGLLFKWLSVPASFILAGLVAAAGFQLSGWGEGVVPDWVTWPAFVVLGTLIGTRFSGTSMANLRRFAVAGLVVTLVAAGCAGVAALIASTFFGLPLTTMLVAYSPGAVEMTTAIAVALDLDPTFVAAHHVFRLMFLLVLVPIFLRRPVAP